MKISTFNANSIRARLPIIIEWLNTERPDILCIQETKVQDPDFPVEPLQSTGYHIAFKGQKSYNGVAVLSRAVMSDVRSHLNDVNEADARFLSGKIDQISIINVYVPQGFAVGSDKFDYKLRWMDDLLSHIKKNYDPHTPLILVGDFNVALTPLDVYDPEGFKDGVGFHPDEHIRFKAYIHWGLVDVFRKLHPDGGHYTFWDYRIPNGFKRNLGWRIDYILATKSLAENVSHIWIDTEARAQKKPSDHTFLTAEFLIGN